MTFRTVSTTVLLVWTLLAGFTAAKPADETRPLTVGAIFERGDAAAVAAFNAAIEEANQAGSRLEGRVVYVPNNEAAIRAEVCTLLRKGVVALVTNAGPQASSIAASIASKHEIPHFAIDKTRPGLDVFSMQMWPDSEALFNVAQREIGERNGPVAVVVQDENTITLRELKKTFGPNTRKYKWSSSPVVSLIMAKTKKIRNFVFIIPASSVAKLLREISVRRMDGAAYSYFIISPDATGLSRAPQRIQARVQFISIAPRLPSAAEGGVGPRLRAVLRKAVGKPMLQIPANAALIFDATRLLAKAVADSSKQEEMRPQSLSCSGTQIWNQGAALLNSIQDLTEEGVTGPIQHETGKADRTGFRPQIYDIVKITEKRRRRPSRQASASSLDGKKLRIVTLASKLFVTKTKKNGKDEFGGFAIELLKTLAKEAGFTYTLYEVSDGKFGSDDGSGNWNGMIGEVAAKRADMAVGPITITYEREKVVEFATPFMQASTKMLAMKPKSSKPSAFAFLQPLSADVWVVFLIAYVIVSLALFFVAKMSPYEWHRPQRGADVRVNDFSLLTSFWFAISGCLRQYPGMAPRSTAARIVAGFWWLVVLVFFVHYAVNLAPYLKTQRTVSSISSFSDLGRQSSVQPMALEGGSTVAFFKRSAVSTYNSIFQKMSSNPESLKKTYEEGINGVISSGGSAVFIGEGPLLQETVQNNCALQVLQEGIDPKSYGFALQKNSPYRSAINSALLKLVKMQTVNSLERRFLRKETFCDDSSSSEGQAVQLTMGQLYGLFILLFVGLIIGAVGLVLEFVYRKCCGSGEQTDLLPLSDMRQNLTVTTKATEAQAPPPAPAPAATEEPAST